MQVNEVSDEAQEAIDSLTDASGSGVADLLAAAVASGDVAPTPQPEVSAKGLAPSRPREMEYSAPSLDGPATRSWIPRTMRYRWIRTPPAPNGVARNARTKRGR